MLSLVNLSGRLLNDLQTYQREKKQGKINSVLLLADPSYGGSIEAAKKEVKSIIEASRRKLLRLVLREGAAVPSCSGTCPRCSTCSTWTGTATRRR